MPQNEGVLRKENGIILKSQQEVPLSCVATPKNKYGICMVPEVLILPQDEHGLIGSLFYAVFSGKFFCFPPSPGVRL